MKTLEMMGKAMENHEARFKAVGIHSRICEVVGWDGESMSFTPWHCFCKYDNKCKHANKQYTTDCVRKPWIWEMRNVLAKEHPDFLKEKY